jgi:hypothetical protein
MPVYMEISRLHRTVTIVARGKVSPEEVRGIAQQLADAHIRSFAKIVEVAGASTEFTHEQIARVADLLRGDPKEKRGPVAFIIDPTRAAFPQAFAKLTKDEGPINLFKSLREARDWLQRIEHLRTHAEAVVEQADLTEGPEEQTPWSDPDREGLLIRGERQRGVRIRSLNAA